MIKWLIPLLLSCAVTHAQVTIKGATLKGASVGITNLPSSGGGGGCTSAYRAFPGIGTGDRTSIILATKNGSLANWLVDGSLADGKAFFGGDAASNYTFKQDLGSGFVITEFKWYQSDGSTHGTWQVKGSNDDSTYTSIGGTFTLGGATISTITTVSANTTSYRYYELVGVSGSTSATPWLRQIENQNCQ